ncbi:hypothetical protein FLACOL_01058 [Flavobacterium columnare]|uniref:Uncharacterized protein n=2 Tax=Flavobacterium TaxID=237 RepID=A0ABW8PM61_9FLAO|nr:MULTISPECIES: hypothetical protein [Flavobacterium]OWP85804.1 hypothetical protein BWK60_12180 [Flavobacterium covae]QYS89056.1 hypothetical protein JJC05_01005 [Flavobacterium davisii]QYS89173.1 hypothetical protein JJC05_01740 [Flavobacterium davisii]SPE77068.1 hypothetical protein FLACOL_01058 [Flavobacterium columnare]
MIAIDVIKSFFKTGLKPTQDQFSATWDSFWHKMDKIPITQIEGMERIFDAINNISQNQQNIRIVPVGQLLIFKVSPNSNNSVLERGDFVKRIIGDVYIEGVYIDGDIHNISSYDIVNMTEIKQSSIKIM